MKNNKLLQTLGKRIAELRKEKGMSQEDFAEVSGKMINTISNIERGLSDPKVSTLEALAQALKVDITDLFTNIVEKPNKEISNSLETILNLLKEQDDKIQRTALKQIQALLEMK